jgi:hypothetical protein
MNSPGIISLVNGANNNGMVLASGGGLPADQNSWQDYSVRFATGSSVSGDLTIALSVLGNGTTIQADFDNVRLTATPFVPMAPKFGAIKVMDGNLVLSGMGGTPNMEYLWLVATNLSAPVHWQTNVTGTLDGAGAFSNAIPINTSHQATFFKLEMP